MTERQSQERVTIKVAAKALNVDRRTIYRWIEKGLLTKVEEDKKSFVLMDDVRALRDKGHNDKSQRQSHNVTKNETGRGSVTLEMSHYEALLVRLGQLENEKKFLLEYKKDLEHKDKELSDFKIQVKETNKWIEEIGFENKDLKKNLSELRQELERLKKRGLIKRIFNK